MKTPFTNKLRRVAVFAGFFVMSFFLVNCSNDDDDVTPPDEYEFEEDFDEVEDLPEVEDPEPEVEEPETGTVNASEETKAIVSEITNGDGGVSEENKTKLESVSNFGASLPESSTAAAETLDDSELDNILSAEALEGDLAELEQSMEDLPEEMASLLPVIDFNLESEAMAEIQINRSFNDNLKDLDIIAQAVNGDCVEAAQESYDEVITDLETQRDGQLDAIEENYQRRIGEADTRYEDRMALLDEQREAYKGEIKETAVGLLDAAAAADAAGDSELADQLQLLALFYTVEGKSATADWYTEASKRVTDKREEEKALFESLKTEREEAVLANFEGGKAEADAKLSEVTASCHNQGSGN